MRNGGALLVLDLGGAVFVMSRDSRFAAAVLAGHRLKRRRPRYDISLATCEITSRFPANARR